tara:strand:- start:5355 stop:6038 length:684 start_codon:yes stop_codon:yes gene_type:complete
MITEDEIDVIIPAAGMGRRMKSYGPKSLIKIGNSTIIKNQISLLRSYLSNPNIVLVCGFKATLLMNQTPHDIIKVENEKYTETNVARSIGIGLRIVSNSKKLVVIYGDLVFNSEAIKNLAFDKSSIIVTNNNIGDDEVGCVISEKQVCNLMYDLPNKWGQIAIFIGKELELLKELCWDGKNNNKFGFEIINLIIERGGKFKCIENDKIKIIDIDNSKDILKAKDVLL